MAPKITQQLKVDVSGDKVKLFCSVESSVLSVQEVSWYKDGKKLKEDDRFKLHYAADGTYELNIHNLQDSDQGEYTCEIIGEGGSSKTSFQFTGQAFKNTSAQISSLAKTQKLVQKEAEVLELSTQKKATVTSQEKAVVQEEIVKKSLIPEDIKKPSPEVKATTTKMSVSEGERTVLKANVPNASGVKWLLNGVELANSEDYRYGVSGSDHTLTISKATQKDEGILTCEGKTDDGIIKCHFEMNVSKDLSNAPTFITQPKSQNVNEGQNVLLTCEVTGDPSPEIHWFKDNQPVSNYCKSFQECLFSCNPKSLIEESPKEVVLRRSGEASMQESLSSQSFQMSASKQEASFSSSSVTEMKFASMSAKSMSSMKESFVEMSSSSITGKSSLTKMESSTSSLLKSGMRGTPPKIEALPSDISIEEGKVLTISCAFSGEPTPEITWSRRGQSISSQGGRFHIETCEDLTTFIIMDVQKNDEGLYTLNLENDFGIDSATVNINIRSM
uniref:Ig-like domain-containing protein n=1 Tax=Naja naja TaxID=35670 RepID=A0A8C6V297_NAJNA